MIDSSDYRLDPSRPSGTVFQFPEEHPPQFYCHHKNATVTSTPEFDLGQIVKVIDQEDDYFGKEAHILSIPLQPNDPYTLQFVNDNTISHYQSIQINQLEIIIPNQSMPRSLQGFLIKNNDGWFFKPGRKLESSHPLKN
mmetsp:Transcript_3327/g.4658  ORF Transcript_3327/g.4658 Transcript_3327/m.4658 type:complete len:139 (-) Transcript_3327:2040-2456(-)